MILPQPSDDTDFFNTIKELSNKLWETANINQFIYGFQIQRGTKWKAGLTNKQLQEFESVLGFNFPKPLHNYYMTMNGLDKPGINIFGNSEHSYAYRPVFYSYPDDLRLIKEYIDWIFEANQTDNEKLKSIGASRVFPIFHHRCMLVDDPSTPILSIYGNDIVYFADSLSKLLASEIFGQQVSNAGDFISSDSTDKIKFWLDEK